MNLSNISLTHNSSLHSLAYQKFPSSRADLVANPSEAHKSRSNKRKRKLKCPIKCNCCAASAVLSCKQNKRQILIHLPTLNHRGWSCPAICHLPLFTSHHQNVRHTRQVPIANSKRGNCRLRVSPTGPEVARPQAKSIFVQIICQLNYVKYLDMYFYSPL